MALGFNAPQQAVNDAINTLLSGGVSTSPDWESIVFPLACQFFQPQVTGANFGAGVNHNGMRVVIPKDGLLRDLSVFVGTAAGNVEVAVLDTAATTRNILYKSGNVAVAGTNVWQVIADPQLPVSRGDALDFEASFSSATVRVAWLNSFAAGYGDLPTGYLPVTGGATNQFVWLDNTSSIPYGSTTTVSESLLTNTSSTPLVIGRIS